MSEQPFDIDSAEAAFEAARQGKADPDPEVLPSSVLPPEDGDGEASPADPALDPDKIEVEELPGFLEYDDYIAQGGDPDMYRGRKAYAEEYQRIQDNKELRREVKELNGLVRTTVEAVDTWQASERERMKEELEAQLHQQKEDEDLEGALATQRKLDKIENEPEPEPKRTEHPIIQEFRTANPLADPNSEQYNVDFAQDLAGIYNSLLNQVTNGGKATEGQMKRCLKKATADAKALHSDLFESPRNQRRTPGQDGTPQRRAAEREPAPKAENYVIDNPQNPTQRNAAADVREAIRKEAVKAAKKAGKSNEDAEKAGDRAAERFEKSLMS